MTDTGVKRVTPNLRSLTAARVSLPMSGYSLATSEVLKFQLAHAQARDAVQAALDAEAFARRLRDELPVLQEQGVEVLTLRSCAVDRASYLRHPQRGRSLHAESAAALKPTPCDLAISIADGLSALAVERNAIPLLAVLVPRLAEADWTLGPVTVVQQGRVGVCDAIGERLGARCSLMLIGERPGLSAADSMGA
jgi:ethanolamine ammonia-lyase small subunit